MPQTLRQRRGLKKSKVNPVQVDKQKTYKDIVKSKAEITQKYKQKPIRRGSQRAVNGKSLGRRIKNTRNVVKIFGAAEELGKFN